VRRCGLPCTLSEWRRAQRLRRNASEIF